MRDDSRVYELDALSPRPPRPNIRLIQELAFSLNLGLLIVSAVVFRDLSVPFVRLANLINLRLGLKPIDEAGGYIAFFLSALALAVLAFLLLRSFSSGAGQLLRSIAGPVGIIGAPLCWFYIVRWYGWYPAEVAIVLLLVIVYLLKGSLVHPLLNLMVFILHFGFWTIRFWDYTHNFGALFVPIVGFVSSIAWGKYRESSTGKE